MSTLMMRVPVLCGRGRGACGRVSRASVTLRPVSGSAIFASHYLCILDLPTKTEGPRFGLGGAIDIARRDQGCLGPGEVNRLLLQLIVLKIEKLYDG